MPEVGQGEGMARMLRRLLPDHNPLRRPVDRVEAVIMALLLAVCLAGVPLAAMAAAGHVAAEGLQVERAQASWRQVPAILLRDAPGAARSFDQGALMPLVRAQWAAPDGTSRTGDVYAPDGAKAGTAVTVWTDGSGRLEDAPMKHAYVVAQEALAALVAGTLVMVAVVVGGVVARRALDRYRLAAWDAEWPRTGPRWV